MVASVSYMLYNTKIFLKINSNTPHPEAYIRSFCLYFILVFGLHAHVFCTCMYAYVTDLHARYCLGLYLYLLNPYSDSESIFSILKGNLRLRKLKQLAKNCSRNWKTLKLSSGSFKAIAHTMDHSNMTPFLQDQVINGLISLAFNFS